MDQFPSNSEEGVVKTSANVYFEMGIIKTDLHNLKDDMKELRREQKELLEFMYKVEGGKAWMISMLLIAGSIGGFATALAKYIFGNAHG